SSKQRYTPASLASRSAGDSARNRPSRSARYGGSGPIMTSRSSSSRSAATGPLGVGGRGGSMGRRKARANLRRPGDDGQGAKHLNVSGVHTRRTTGGSRMPVSPTGGFRQAARRYNPISAAIGFNASIRKPTCSSSGRPTAWAPPYTYERSTDR